MMAKRPPIMLGSKRLHEYRIDEIVDIASHPQRKRFDDRPYAPHYMNRSIIRAFAGAAKRTTSEIIAKYPEGFSDWSDEFNALRVGEALGWALQEGIVERGRVHQHRWRLVHTEVQFENVGRGPRKRSIRILNAGDLQPENNKLWARELKTRERHRVKEVAKIKFRIVYSMRQLCRAAPHFDITTVPLLASFAVGDIRTISACREMIEQSVDEMSSNGARDLEIALFKIEMQIRRETPSEPPPPQASAEAVAELDDFSL